MLEYLVGEIQSNENNLILENNGIGYNLLCSGFTLQKFTVGSKVKVLTYLQVKDDGFTLFGFENKMEKDMFLNLITVSGIGPKAALNVLNGVQLPSLAGFIATGNTTALSQIKGVGKKSAERIVLELRAKVQKTDCIDAILSEAKNLSSAMLDAIDGLISLGINRNEATKLAKTHNAETAEQIIYNVLRNR